MNPFRRVLLWRDFRIIFLFRIGNMQNDGTAAAFNDASGGGLTEQFVSAEVCFPVKPSDLRCILAGKMDNAVSVVVFNIYIC